MLASRQIKSFVLCLLALAAFGAGAARAARIEYSDSDPAPMGDLHVARPVVAWKIVPRNGCQVTNVELLLNRSSVRASYEPLHQAVWYTPAASLKPGAYEVHCRVTLDNEYAIDKDWKFTVEAGSIDAIQTPTLEQARVCDAVNQVRRDLNLPALSVDSRLCAAAGGHSAYLSANHVVAHGQSAQMPGYTASTISERVSAFGFVGGCYEAVSQGSVGAAAVRKLFDAPYHRAPFLQPGSFEIGAGAQGDVVTLLFGASSSSAVVGYPMNGQTNVPTTWNGVESPNPLRMHRAGGAAPTGYVITFFSFGPDDARLNVSRAAVTASDGKPVAIFLNTPDNDECLHNGALIIPQQPLRPGVTYRVTVQATDETGLDCSRTWSFTTAGAPPITLLAAKH